MSSFSGVKAINVVVNVMVVKTDTTENTKTLRGLNLSVSSSSNVSSLSITKRNLFRQR